MFPRRKALVYSARQRVSDDWITVLPRDKSDLFETVVRRWECYYAMMSIALDDALSLRSRGELVCARQQTSVASDLLEQLAGSLISFCDTVSTRGRFIDEIPRVEPLRAKFFRGNIGQSAASWNGILHRVLFDGRSRFFHKLRILSGTLRELDREFREVAGDISKGLATQPADSWTRLDTLHYDFNTCLRETEVVLKSFLRALPSDQLAALASELDAPVHTKRLPVNPGFSGAPA